MQPSPQTASTSLPASSAGSTPSRKAETLTYQALTVAAMLLLLGSLWGF